MATLEPGADAPGFELNDLDGHQRNLAELGERDLLLLVFYHSACPTCRFTIPFVAAIAHAFRLPHTKIWGISQDPEDESSKFARESGLQIPILIDQPPFKVAESYGLTNVPTLFLVDGRRKILKTCVGFAKADFDEFAAALSRKAGLPVPDLYGGQQVPPLRPG